MLNNRFCKAVFHGKADTILSKKLDGGHPVHLVHPVQKLQWCASCPESLMVGILGILSILPRKLAGMISSWASCQELSKMIFFTVKGMYDEG